MLLLEDCLTIKLQSESDSDYGTIQQVALNVEPPFQSLNYQQSFEFKRPNLKADKKR